MSKKKPKPPYEIKYNTYNCFWYVIDTSANGEFENKFVARGITNRLHAEDICKLYQRMWREQWEIDEALGTHEPIEIKYEVMP